MNDIKNHFSYIREDLALSDEERSLMRAELVRLTSPLETTILSPFTFSFFSSGSLRFAGAFAVLVVAALGGSSALAHDALPGDALYSVKIHLNENVERTLAPSPLAKAIVDINHAEERLSEVELLAAKGEADSTDLENVAEEVAANVASASDTAHDLANSGDEAKADGIHAKIASTLLAHADILDAQAGSLDNETSGRSLRALSFAVSATADEADASRDTDSEGGETDAVTAQVALDREAQVQGLVVKLRTALDGENIPDETHAQLLSELASIEADYGETRELVAKEDFENAGAYYEKIEQRAYRALALLTAATRINETTGKDVVITLDDSTSSADERPALMKATATLSAPAVENQALMAATDTETTGTLLRKGDADDGNTLKFRVRARSWNP